MRPIVSDPRSADLVRILAAIPLAALVLALAGCALPDSAARPADGSAGESLASDGTEGTIAARVAELERREGLLPVFVDETGGTLWLELPAPTGRDGVCVELLVNHGLRRGLGSNPVGLDRGQLRGADLVRIRRVGPRVLFERPNLGFRAPRGDAAERRAAEESFATSVIWATEAEVVDPDGRALIDLREFLVRDAHGVVDTLERTSQGKYRLDADRSAIELAETLVFPDNLEFEATLTFAATGRPGRFVRSTAPDADAVSLVQHLSLVRLPDDGFRPRPFDPRAGSFSVGYLDYSAPLDESIEVRYAVRHRADRPIVYHVDRGAPEPIRSALLEGARWWSEAFAEAGLPDRFRVELLPEDAHPLDVRYHVIQWVHRSTRGWSYGASIVDPRTGEILKGHVSLGSLRVRQDRRLFEGLAGTAKTGTGAPDDPIELALARIRQLSAHEVGHTLGLAHNFAASTQGRASVMDYPPPRVTATEAGTLDFSEAYAVGIGAWDRHAIRALYAPLPDEGDHAAAVAAIVEEGLEAGLLYLTDADARPAGASDPRASLWDDGDDAIAALENACAVRHIAIDTFGSENLPDGEPLGHLEEVFAPVYLHHRYQLDAAVKAVGGMTYVHARNGDGQPLAAVIPAERQRAALDAILATTDPAFLDIPERVLVRLLPPAPGSWASRERFWGRAEPAFDRLSAAATAADLAITGLLAPERCARLVDQSSRDPEQLSLGEVLDRFAERICPRDEPELAPREVAIERGVRRAMVAAMIERAGGDENLPTVRDEIDGKLNQILVRFDRRGRGNPRALFDDEEARFRSAVVRDIERHLARTPAERVGETDPPEPPPGSPISGAQGTCGP